MWGSYSMVTRLYQRLIDEHGMDGVSHALVQRYVKQRRPEIAAEMGRGPAKVFIPQTHRRGEEAEVDFGDIAIRLRGELATCYLLCYRMSWSGTLFTAHSLVGRAGSLFRGPPARAAWCRWRGDRMCPLRRHQEVDPYPSNAIQFPTRHSVRKLDALRLTVGVMCVPDRSAVW